VSVTTTRGVDLGHFVRFTSEGDQEMGPRSAVGAAALMREVGAVLRMSEAEVAALGLSDDADQDAIATDDDRMIINLGPQHPSTHGVLRLMLELQGETVLRCKPVIGYLHTGMEKTAESLTYVQGGTNVTRMDYLAPFFNELAFSMAAERLLGIEVPPRAIWIRMLLSELNRISSHILFLATNGMDMAAVSMMLYGWREREEVLRFFQKVTGLRMNHNFIRVGGTAADLPDGWRDDVLRLLDAIPPRLDEYDVLMTNQPIWRGRLQGVGTITSKSTSGYRMYGMPRRMSQSTPVERSTGPVAARATASVGVITPTPCNRSRQIGCPVIRVPYPPNRGGIRSSSRSTSSRQPGGRSAATPPGRTKLWFIRRPVTFWKKRRTSSRSRQP